MTVAGKLVQLASGYGLLEGARWYPEHGLVFSDMTSGGVFRLRDNTIETLIPHRKAIGGLVAHADGGLVVSGRNVSAKAEDGATTVLLDAAPDEQFFNDITADGRGRLFAGSVPSHPGPPDAAGRLYLIDLDGSATVIAGDVLISNGIAADPHDTLLYHVDSGRRTIWRFALGAADIGASREAFVSTAEYDALPDGLAMAADSSIWAALAGAGLVVGWEASGARIAEIPVPHALATSLCFGGAELDELYVLTGTNAEYPNADGGSVFRTAAPRIGLPAPKARVHPARPAPGAGQAG
jgi:gluconolactonase